MAKKTTPKERREYIQQQRKALASSPLHGRVFGDMSFIDREGNIVRPNKKDYEADLKRGGGYPLRTKGGHYQPPAEARRYGTNEQTRASPTAQDVGGRVTVFKPSSNRVEDAAQEFVGYIRKEAQKAFRAYKRYQAVIATLGLLGAIFFLSPNITGNAIGNMTNSSSSTIGIIFLFVGLIAGFFTLKNKSKVKY